MNKHGSGPNGHSPNTMMLYGIYNGRNTIDSIYNKERN